MKILKAEVSTSKDKKFYIRDNKLITSRFGMTFTAELEENDAYQVTTIVDYCNGKIEDRSIYESAKSKFNKSFESALDIFIKNLNSQG